ncbi:MAG: translation initiation factor IF-2 [Bdellovibrionaceae bacterium]|nr:translation initiation factor IF-2 [Pseudobdellovibrionaceae bacterium]
MQEPRVFEFAKQIGVETLDLMDKIRKWDLPVKSHMATLDAGTQDEIKRRLEEEKGSVVEAKAKKTTKKKKKAAAKKKTVAKKTAVKKAVTKKTLVRKKATAEAEAEGPAAEAAPKKKVARKKTVIRRKAGVKEAPEPEITRVASNEPVAPEPEVVAAPEAQPAEVAPEAVTEQQQAAPEAAAAVEPTTEAPAAPAAKAEETPAAVPNKMGRRIVGKIDLDKVKPPMGARRGPRDGGAGQPGRDRDSRPRATGPRNIRAGFVAAPQPAPSFQDDARKKGVDDRARKKPAPAAAAKDPKEQPVQSFTASEFRKREVIFQPKRKRIVTGDLKKTEITKPKASKRVVRMYESILVSDLADQLKVKMPQVTKILIKNGVMARPNTPLDYDTASLIAGEFDYEVETLHRSIDELLDSVAFGDLEADRQSRPPVVTVMGHVDHGKTTLLDSIRNANVVKGEAGGITQHIGAYQVTTKDGHLVTFIDTPGHAAFTEMRARGANVTDVAIIVVAADDGVMPQTEEAINHAKAAGVPIIVAVNKIDKPDANPEKVKQQLTEYELVPEEWGGDTIFVEVSALAKTGLDALLEQIYLLAEMGELKANPARSGSGLVIESRMEKGKGAVATLLVQEGTLKSGDTLVVGEVVGRVRAMMSDRGERLKEALPSRPVEIMGLPDAPQAGDRFDVTKTEADAERLAQSRKDMKVAEAVPSSKMSLDQIFAKVKTGDLKELPVILKGDVAGSIEAIKGSFSKIETDEVKVKVIHSAVGGISESDVLLASTAGGLILGFNVRPDGSAERLAKEKNIEIRTYSIIYELLDEIKQAMAGLLDPDIVEETLGRAEVRETFSVPKIGVIAGCSVTDGKIVRNAHLRLVREGRVVYEGKIGSLKRFKDDAKEVQSGYECGIGIENYNDLKVGDVIEAYELKEVARDL